MQGQSVRRIVYRLPARLGSNEAGRRARGSWSRYPGGAIPSAFSGVSALDGEDTGKGAWRIRDVSDSAQPRQCFGAGGGARTRMPLFRKRRILSPLRLPISPRRPA